MRFKTLLFSVSIFFIFNISKASSSTDSILARYKRFLFNSTSIKDVDKRIPEFAFNLAATNRWGDIDYTDTSPAYWQTRNHLGRVELMAVAWSNQQSKYYKNEKVWKTLSSALDHWLDKRYKNSNWWVNEIGVPQGVRDILVLVGQNLTATQRSGALEVLAQHKVRGVGANLIWSADLAIHYGALVNDEAMIKRSVELISREIKVSTGEGIQPDYSYHQHESRLQIYHYGRSFLETNVRIAWEMHKTLWAFPPDKINILTNFILHGWQWMARGINTVPGTIDRAASRKDQLHNADLRALIPYLCDLDPAYTIAFHAIADRQNSKGKPVTGFKYYPYSDFSAYHQNNFAFLLKTISTRTLKSESINTENLKGRLLNNGDGYLISNGNEYFNMMPVWNWNFLPGQTNSHSASDTIINRSFAGSVTDGKTGLTALDYAVGGDGNTITAHKIWASNGNTVVCLISNVTTNNRDSVFTALDQCKWQGAVEINKPGNVISTTGINEIKNVAWLHHAGFGYILLNPSTIQVQLHVVTSSWSAINQSSSADPVTEKVFMPLLLHNAANNSSTGYVLVSAKTANQVQSVVNKPTWKVTNNDSSCQAVTFNDGTTMAAFFNAGSARLGKQLVTVQRPCLIQITNSNIFISDPLHKGGVINFSLNGKKYSASLNEDGSTKRLPL